MIVPSSMGQNKKQKYEKEKYAGPRWIKLAKTNTYSHSLTLYTVPRSIKNIMRKRKLKPSSILICLKLLSRRQIVKNKK